MRLDYTELHGVSTAFPGTVRFQVRDLAPGVYAFVGPNGDGKSILLEAGFAGLYRELPSRDENLIDFALHRDSYIVNEYSADDGSVLRTRISLDGPERAIKAVVESVGGDGKATLLTDGKVSTFEAFVESRFPTKDLMLMGPFACQTREGGFFSRGPARRKELWAEMVGLAHIELKAQTADCAADEWDKARVQLLGAREALVRDTAPEIADALHARANAIQAEGGQAEWRRRDLRADIDRMAAERATLTKQAETHLKAIERIEALKVAIATRTAELTQVGRDEGAARQSAGAERARADEAKAGALSALDQRLTDERVKHDAIVTECDTRIAGNHTLTANAERYRTAAAEKESALRQREDLRREKDDASDRREQALEQVRVRRQQLDASVDSKLASAREQAGLIDRVKFGEQCGGADPCILIVNAVAAQAQIPALETAVKQADALREGITLWQERANGYAETIKAKSIAIARVEARLTELEHLAKYVPELAAVEARIEGYEQRKRQAASDLAEREADIAGQRARVIAAYEATLTDIAQRLGARLSELADRHLALTAAQEQAAGALSAAESDAEATKAAAERLRALDAALTAANQGWTDNEATLAAIAEKLAALDRDRTQYAEKCRQLEDVDRKLAIVGEELRAWQQNATALGKDGVQIFEIEQAAPAVTSASNDLLHAGGMSRFTLELITQVAKISGGQRETFDLQVWDNGEYAGERKMGSLAGGQKALGDSAIRYGIALYHNTRSDHPFKTCWLDETAGALDAEMAPHYIAMLRRLRELGNFDHVFFVVHNLEIAAQADGQVRIAGGAIEIGKWSEPDIRKWLAQVYADRIAA